MQKFEILTDTGWSKFEGVKKSIAYRTLTITLDDGDSLECTLDHKIMTQLDFVEAKNVSIGDAIKTAKGFSRVIKVDIAEGEKAVYDVVGVEKNSRYFTNDVLSHNCSFVGTSGSLISAAALGNIKTINPLRETNGIRQFKEPERKNSYVMVVDVSRGKGLDYSTFSVFDTTKMPYDQVCTFRSNTISPIDYATIILKIATMYNEAFVLVEVNDIGAQVSDVLHMDYGYENLVFTETKAGRKRISGGFGGGNVDKGVRTTSSVKRLGCNMLKLLVEQSQLIINDEYTHAELENFELKGSSYEAKSGYHDDMVMTLVLFAWMTEQTFFRENTDIDTMSALKEKSDEDWDSELTPFGFVDDGNKTHSNWRL